MTTGGASQKAIRSRAGIGIAGRGPSLASPHLPPCGSAWIPTDRRSAQAGERSVSDLLFPHSMAGVALGEAAVGGRIERLMRHHADRVVRASRADVDELTYGLLLFLSNFTKDALALGTPWHLARVPWLL